MLSSVGFVIIPVFCVSFRYRLCIYRICCGSIGYCVCITLLRRPLDRKLQDMSYNISVFDPDVTKAVGLPISYDDWGCIIQEERELDRSFMDFLRRHIVYRADPSIRCQFHLTYNWIAHAMEMQLTEKKMTWDAVVVYIYRTLRIAEGRVNTLVVPYNNKGHWSLYIVEEYRTWYIDTLSIHNDQRARNFESIIHMAWALVMKVPVASDKWYEWQKRRVTKV